MKFKKVRFKIIFTLSWSFWFFSINHEILNKDGSKLQLQMDYTPLLQIDLQREDKLAVNVLKRKSILLFEIVFNSQVSYGKL